MDKENKIRIINDIPDERHLREKVLRILLQKMEYRGVTVTHGADEHGRDLVFYQLDEKTGIKEYYAIIAKVGRLKGGSGSEQENIINIHNQVKKAFFVPYEDPETKQRVPINHAWVVNNNSCSNAARREILELFGDTKSLVERNVTFIDESGLLKYLEQYWEEFFAQEDPFIFEYSTTIKKRFALLDELKLLGYSKEIKKVLDVFVEPTLLEERKKISKEKRIAPIDFRFYTTQELLNTTEDIWITGQAGSGKTTLLKKIILKLLENIDRDEEVPKIPCLLNFRDLCKDVGILTIDEAIIARFDEFNEFKYEINPVDWLSSGRLCLFLDGFDELSTEIQKDQIIDNLKMFKAKYPNVKIYCACRGVDLELQLKLPSFRHIKMLPLNYKQMVRFLDRWFLANEGVKSQMLEALRKTALAGKLPKTPMVLTLLAILFEEKPIKELPANLTELYIMFTDLFLGRWDIQRSVNTMFEYTIKDNILLNLAYTMHDQRKDTISEEALLYFIQEYSQERRTSIDPQQLISEIVGRSQLIYKDLKGHYAFKHLSFQEFFVSKKWIQITNISDSLLKSVLDPWWENVVFFYVGSKKEAPEILSEILERCKPQNLGEKIRKYLNLGQLLQAAYLTKHEMKKQTIRYAADEFSKLYNEVYKEVKNTEFGKRFSKFFILLIMEVMFQKNYCSSTLVPAMEEVFHELITTRPKSTFEDLLQMTMLAYTLGTLQKQEALAELASNPVALDPPILLLVQMNLSEITDEYGAKFSEDTIKKVKNRVRHIKSAILPFLK